MSTSNERPTVHLVVGRIVCGADGGAVSPNMLTDVNCDNCLASTEYDLLKQGHAVIRKGGDR